jgi:hypothetical protein
MTLLPHKMDNAIDDVVVLVENQYEITEGTSVGRLQAVISRFTNLCNR